MSKCGLVWGCAVFAVAMNLSVAARAQAEPTSKDGVAPSSAPPDIVRMKDGGLLRGTIAESVPGGFVTIVLLTGETRKVAASEIDYAGPADAAPSPPKKQPANEGENESGADANRATQPRDSGAPRPFVTVHAAEANISFRSTPNGHTLYRRDVTATAFGSNGVGVAAEGFAEICTAPCDASLPAGTYTFGVSKPKGVAVKADQITLPAGSSQLHADYTDNSGLRIAGWVVMIGGVAVGSGLLLAGLESGGLDCSSSTYECTEKPKNMTLIYAGGALEVGGVIAGLVLVNQKDGVSLSVAPGAPRGGRQPSGSVAVADRALPKGLTLSGTF